jgi:hypothetical protein
MRPPSAMRPQNVAAPQSSRRSRLQRKLALCWALSAVALALPATAQGTFSGVDRLSAAGQNAKSPDVAMDPGGNSVLVWENRSTGSIQARVRSAAGALTATQTLSDVGQAVSRPRLRSRSIRTVVWIPTAPTPRRSGLG